ncbi:MAG: type IV pilin protein [Gammaproteobacteria bacterium]|nr:type IV pilin protein [Gammaproteobacteria bacterium]MDH5516061.1 type IV pilin protein [Gammaproteobacteria bacterium]
MNKQRGVTLIELLIVIVVLGILVAVGYPSYTKQVQRTKRAECAGGLVQLAQRMERDFSENNTYSDLGGGVVATCPSDGGGATTYNLTVREVTASTYILRAAPVNAQASDACGWLELDNLGRKFAENGTVDNCWR